MGTDVGEVGRCWPKSTKLQLGRMNKPRDPTHSVMSVVNNTVLNTGIFAMF